MYKKSLGVLQSCLAHNTVSHLRSLSKLELTNRQNSFPEAVDIPSPFKHIYGACLKCTYHKHTRLSCLSKLGHRHIKVISSGINLNITNKHTKISVVYNNLLCDYRIYVELVHFSSRGYWSTWLQVMWAWSMDFRYANHISCILYQGWIKAFEDMSCILLVILFRISCYVFLLWFHCNVIFGQEEYILVLYSCIF